MKFKKFKDVIVENEGIILTVGGSACVIGAAVLGIALSNVPYKDEFLKSISWESNFSFDDDYRYSKIKDFDIAIKDGNVHIVNHKHNEFTDVFSKENIDQNDLLIYDSLGNYLVNQNEVKDSYTKEELDDVMSDVKNTKKLVYTDQN